MIQVFLFFYYPINQWLYVLLLWPVPHANLTHFIKCLYPQDDQNSQDKNS